LIIALTEANLFALSNGNCILANSLTPEPFDRVVLVVIPAEFTANPDAGFVIGVPTFDWP
jgi:hypothetical protein